MKKWILLALLFSPATSQAISRITDGGAGGGSGSGGGDNLGSHVATKTISAPFGIQGASFSFTTDGNFTLSFISDGSNNYKLVLRSPVGTFLGKYVLDHSGVQKAFWGAGIDLYDSGQFAFGISTNPSVNDVIPERIRFMGAFSGIDPSIHFNPINKGFVLGESSITFSQSFVDSLVGAVIEWQTLGVINVSSGAFQVAGKDVCLEDGTNCSASGGNLIEEFYWTASDLLPYEYSANSIAPVVLSTGLNNDVFGLGFDAATDECRGVTLKVPNNSVGSGGVTTFRSIWFSTVSTSGNVVWDIRHSSGQAEGASWDVALSTVSATADAVQGTVKLLTFTSWTADTGVNLAWAANDYVSMEVCRDADNAADTMAFDAQLLGFAVEIEKTQ